MFYSFTEEETAGSVCVCVSYSLFEELMEEENDLWRM